jgi:hypothetical protein
MSFAEPLKSYLKQREGSTAFGTWKLSSFRMLDSDVGYAMGLDALFLLYGEGKEQINILVTYHHKAGADLLKGHSLTQKDKEELRKTLETLGYREIVIQDFNE